MTKEQFDNTGFRKGMKVTINLYIKSEVYNIVGVDFCINCLLLDYNTRQIWVNYEYCTIVEDESL